jgi:nitroreductase
MDQSQTQTKTGQNQQATSSRKSAIPLMQTGFATKIQEPWTRMRPVRLGNVPDDPAASPNLYVTVGTAANPILLIALYAYPGKVYGFEEVRIWNDYVAIGFGRHAYIVSMVTRGTAEYDLESDFCQFFPLENMMLMASLEGLGAVDTMGNVVWDVKELAQQGVLVERAADGRISGRGKFTDGWKPFLLEMTTGQAL